RRYIDTCHAANDDRFQIWRDAKTRAFGYELVGSNDFAAPDRNSCVKAAPALLRHFHLFRARAILDSIAERRFHVAQLAHHCTRLTGLNRKSVIRTRQTSIEGEVLFDQACP